MPGNTLGRSRHGKIIEAVKNRELPHTTGFFFGASEDSEERRQDDIAIFKEAIAWLSEKETRRVHYQASW